MTGQKRRFGAYCIEHRVSECKKCDERIMVKSIKRKLGKIELLQLIEERHTFFERLGVYLFLSKDGRRYVADRTTEYFKKVLNTLSEEEVNEYFLTKI